MASKSRIPALVGSIATLALLAGPVGCAEAELDELEVYARTGVFSDGSVQGSFVHRVSSMLDGTSRDTLHLVDGPRDTQIIVSDAMRGELHNGMMIRAYGPRDSNGVMTVSSYEVVTSALIDPELLPFRRLATVLLFWEGTTTLSNGSARESMFAGDRSTNVFYGENSYGRETLAGEVFGPYEIEDPGWCNTSFMAEAGKQAMADRGHNEMDFSQLMFHFPTLDCGFSGQAGSGSPELPARNSYYNGSFGCVVRNQEIGHNYGMNHSHDYNGCPADDPISENCTHDEYGDTLDPMGGGCAHINVVQKEYMGWLEGCNIVRTTSSGRFNLMPVELPCNGTQSLRFEAYDGRDYYLEYRTPIGAFTDFQGVLLHVAKENPGSGPSTYLLRIGANGVLFGGDSYTDAQNGVTFTVVSTESSHAVIDIEFPGGGSGSPVCADGSAPELDAGTIGSLMCDALPFQGDEEAPVVEITYPLDGDVFAPGSDFVIIVEATDDREVVEAELYLDGEALNKKLEGPWEWEVNDIAQGQYELGVVARDAVNFGLSNVVTFTVAEIPEETGSSGEPEATTDDSGSGSGATAGSTPGDESCGCRTKGGPAPAFGLIMLGLFFARRRRAGLQN